MPSTIPVPPPDAAVIFWENVPGVLSTEDNAFGCFLAGLAGEADPLQPPGPKWGNAGCVIGPRRTVAWRTLDAQFFGLAQRRRRVFVVASARPGFDPLSVLFEWEGVRRDTAPSRQAGQETASGTLRSSGGGSDVDHARAQPLIVDVAHALRGEGFDASEDGTGRGTPLVACYGGNRTAGPIEMSPALLCAPGSGFRGDFESETLIAFNHSAQADQLPTDSRDTSVTDALTCSQGAAVAFSCKDHGADATRDLAPTMRAMGHAGSHANGGGQIAVAFTTKLHNTQSNQAGKVYEEYTTALDANSPPPALLTPLQVRRLMPVECERLQGFPDDFTRIPSWAGWRKLTAGETPESCAAEGLEVRQNPKTGVWRVRDVDGPRYRAIGNSWAIPCVEWIGRRIDAQVRA